MTVGLWARSLRTVSVRYLVAPTATGSSTQGTPLACAVAAARSIAATHGAESVPILMTRLDAMGTNSSTSSTAWTMAGEAPMASSALAVTFITTKLVMLWTSGWRARSRLKAEARSMESTGFPLFQKGGSRHVACEGTRAR